jgi:hypothetical protein
MQEDLSGLASELRKETCPRRVIDGAWRRIAAETPVPRRLRYAIPRRSQPRRSCAACSFGHGWRTGTPGGNPN